MKAAADFFVREKYPISNTCFVLMPFEDGMNAVYEHGIKPCVEELGIKCRRADELYSAQGILGDIWTSVQSAEIVIADLTNKNPNVMYELGLCHTLWKHVILICQNKDDVPFDLRNWRVIWYDFTFAGAARLKEELQRAIVALRQEPINESTLVPLNTSGGEKLKPPGPEVTRSPRDWYRGEVTAWFEDKAYGFIRSGDENFYFNWEYLFPGDCLPQLGQQVSFVPMDALQQGKNRRASQVFIHGIELEGTVTRIKENGYGFADVLGQFGDHHSLFVLFSADRHPNVGDKITVEIGCNDRGPIGYYKLRED